MPPRVCHGWASAPNAPSSTHPGAFPCPCASCSTAGASGTGTVDGATKTTIGGALASGSGTEAQTEVGVSGNSGASSGSLRTGGWGTAGAFRVQVLELQERLAYTARCLPDPRLKGAPRSTAWAPFPLVPPVQEGVPRVPTVPAAHLLAA